MKHFFHYRVLAQLFDYPTREYPERVKGIMELLASSHPEAARELTPFYDVCSRLSPIEMEELFTRSFEVQAATTLDVGYVLFGDDYKRGELLVCLSREHKKHANECGIELADHLPNVLRLLPKLEDETLLQEFVEEILAPALQKMIQEFDPKRLEQKEKAFKKHYKTIIDVVRSEKTVYVYPLKALFLVLQKDFVFKQKVEFQQTQGFLGSVLTEMEIEGSDSVCS